MTRYEEAVAAELASQQAQYEQTAARMAAAAARDWDGKKGALRLALLEQAASRIEALVNAAGKPHPASERERLLAAATEAIDAELARQRQTYIDEACAVIPGPWPEADIRAMLAHLRDPEQPPAEPAGRTRPDGKTIYRLADGRLYDVAAGLYRADAGLAAEEEDRVIDLGGDPTDANLKETLAFYGLPVPAFLQDVSELFASLRAERDRRIAATDYLVCVDYPLDSGSGREEVLAYRAALRDLPALAGAPWDGGGPETPWPALPQAAAAVKEVA